MYLFLNRSFILLIIVVLMVFINVMGGCAEEPVTETAELYVAPLVEEAISINGSKEDYPGESITVAGSMEVLMAHDGSSLYLYARSETDGWVALGFNSQGGGMDGANILIGYLHENDSPAVRNDLGQGHSHSETTNGVEEYHIERGNGEIIMELAYPLDFPTEAGFNLEGLNPGQETVYTLIAAFNTNSHDPNRQHSRFDMESFTLE